MQKLLVKYDQEQGKLSVEMGQDSTKRWLYIKRRAQAVGHIWISRKMACNPEPERKINR